MKINIKIINGNRAHITFDVFVNGARSGQLILRQEEFYEFTDMLEPEEIDDPLQKLEFLNI